MNCQSQLALCRDASAFIRDLLFGIQLNKNNKVSTIGSFYSFVRFLSKSSKGSGEKARERREKEKRCGETEAPCLHPQIVESLPCWRPTKFTLDARFLPFVVDVPAPLGTFFLSLFLFFSLHFFLSPGFPFSPSLRIFLVGRRLFINPRIITTMRGIVVSVLAGARLSIQVSPHINPPLAVIIARIYLVYFIICSIF